MFAALSHKTPEIEASLEKFIALAPIAFLHHLNHGLIGKINSFKFLEVLGENPLQEVYSYSKRYKSTLVLCKISPSTCNIATQLITGETTSCVDTSRLPYMRTHGPGGTSLKNVMHFEQMMHTPHKKLPMFDYGPEKNKEKYGSETPYEYPLHKISGVEIHFMQGDRDHLSNEKDLKELKQILGENIKSEKIYNLCHSSFNYGHNTNDYVSDIIKILSK
eukprot:TRINITY_DN4557_c0_g1_i7.p1 TRINITY_DN4557_c0_g1~~TRINITY_DN4557_c0_g1_i7.p1  ORF type:complete len:219 (-),score=49.99 TRINITY_DN4557_c0_g1_i7:153-809(-)